MKRISRIEMPDKVAMNRAREQWNTIAKPLGSLGLLEEAVVKIAGIQGTEKVDISQRCVAVMCADNGVVAKGISQSDSSVTAVCTKSIAEGSSNINCMAECFNADVIAVDIGVRENITSEKLIDRKIAHGTNDISEGPAMSVENAQRAISVGIDIVRELSEKGVQIIVTGEMGIGNTTTAAALASVLLNLSPDIVTGRGAGLSSEGLKRKIEVIKKSVEINHPDPNKPIELLSELGGFDIAGITGLFLGSAIYKIPVIIDGAISAVSALLACKINPLCANYMLASHISAEPTGKLLLEEIGVKPLISAEMRLGEGTGGVLLLPLLDAALSVYNSSHKFDSIGIERYVELK